MSTQKYGPYTITASSSDGLTAGSAQFFEPRDAGAAVIQITGTFTATIQFEASNDLTNYFALPVTPVAGGADVTSATAAGRWRANLSGIQKVRVRCSAYTSGSPVITSGLTPGSLGLQSASVSGTVAVSAVTVVGGATDIGKLEDAAHASGDAGVFMLGVRKDTVADTAGTDGDYEALTITGGNLNTVNPSIKAEDVASANADPLTVVGVKRSLNPANSSGTDGDYEPLQVDGGCLWVKDRSPIKATGVTSAVFSSADASTPAAITDAPTAGAKIVLDAIVISSITALTINIQEETSGTQFLKFVVAANSQPIVITGIGLKAATADKKLLIQTSGAGQIYCTALYHSES